MWGAACFFSAASWAGSCCGGGSASALMLPKAAHAMIDTSLEIEKYDGFWTKGGGYQRDQPGTDLKQYRLNLGYALRIAPQWQASLAFPYIWNDNAFSGLSSRSEGMGDASFNLWYEAYDGAMCRLGVDELGDLTPSATIGLSLTIPTGVSPYDSAQSSFDITGRGFYRLDANMLLDKTIYPWSASLLLSYGIYPERPINREYGEYVQPYRKQLGDRSAGTLALSYADMIDFMGMRKHLTYTAAFSEVREDEGTINGNRDPTGGLRKDSIAGTIVYSTLDRAWSLKLTWSHSIHKDGWGNNTPASDIYSMGINHAFE